MSGLERRARRERRAATIEPAPNAPGPGRPSRRPREGNVFQRARVRAKKDSPAPRARGRPWPRPTSRDDTVGANAIAFSVSHPTQVHLFGYPAASPYDCFKYTAGKLSKHVFGPYFGAYAQKTYTAAQSATADLTVAP